MKPIRFIFYCIFLFFSFMSCKKETAMTDKIYTIELDQFNIKKDSDYKDSIQSKINTIGINEALQYAKEQGYTTIRFPKGTYAVFSEWGLHRNEVPETPGTLAGIRVPSQITLDLSDAVFRLYPNSRFAYSLFLLYKVEEVTLMGGHLIGDRHEHEYALYPEGLESNTHEWGYGINIAASKNIIIKGVSVEQMTGDAIMINGYDPEEKINENIIVTECILSDCRRQGISLVCGIHTEIRHNRIDNIIGTNPQFGIDVEVLSKYGYVCKHTQIHHNHITHVGVAAIGCHRGDYIDVYENTTDNIIGVLYSEYVKIYNNVIKGSTIYLSPESKNVEVYNNQILP